MGTTKEKTCENCRFYLQHYIKKSTGYISTDYGHCSNYKMRINNRSKLREDCALWQPIEIQIEEHRKNLKSNINELVKRLNLVCEILIDDND